MIHIKNPLLPRHRKMRATLVQLVFVLDVVCLLSG